MFLALKNALGKPLVATYKGLLDSFGGASAAYSLRRLSGSYTGDAVRIRRVSDDVEVGVGFNGGSVSTSSPIEQAELGSNRAGVILFDGVDDDINVNAALLPTDDFTLTIKAFVTLYPSSDATIFGQGTGSGTGRMVLQIQTDGQAFVFLNGVGSFTTANTFNLNEINTIVFSRSGDDYSLTLNAGTAVTNNSSGSPEQVNSQIGDGYSGANFAGSIQSLTVGAVTWDGTQSDALSKSWTVNGSPELSVVVPATLGELLEEATPARNRTGSARYDTLTPNGVTGFTAVTNNIAACGFDIAGTSGTAVNVSFDITLNSGSVAVSLRPEFETGSDVSHQEVIASSGSKSFTLTSTGDFKAMLFITASADYVVSNFSVNVPYNHSATVHTWYDQTGNGRHGVQLTAANQPSLAISGVLRDNLFFDGGDDSLSVNSTVSTSIPFGDGTVAAVHKSESAGRISSYIYNGNTSSSAKHLIGSNSSGNFLIYRGASASGSQQDTNLNNYIGIFDNSSGVARVGQLYVRGSLVASTTSMTTADFDSDTMSIGNYGNLHDNLYELILWSDPDVGNNNRTAIDADVETYYGIS